MKPAPSSLSDASAVGLSGLCLAHCLALPLVAASSPLVATWAEAEWVHAVVIALAAPISILSLWRKGRGATVIALSATGLAFLTAGALHWPTAALETQITVAGSLILAAAHLINWRRRHAH